MKSRTIYVFAITIFLMLGISVVCAQQSVDETNIAQMRATVQKLEGLAGDANIPIETREHLNELLFEKRGELHNLLRQKRDALRSSLRGKLSTQDVSRINSTIRELTQQMQQLMNGASTAASMAGESAQLPDEGTGSDPAVSSNGNATVTSSTEMTAVTVTSAPVAPATTVSAPAGPMTAATMPATVPGSTAPVALTAPLTPVPASAAGPAAPQNDPCVGLPSGPAPPDVEYKRQIKAAACRIFRARAGTGNAGDAQLNFQAYNLLMLLAITNSKIAKVAIPELTAQAENASNSKNLGASESNSGSTSLVAKAGVPAILGFAVENGALAKTASGTTVTFTGNPVGLVQAMAKKGFISSFQEQDDFTKFLRKLSFGLSFDTSRGSQPGTFTADKQQLSGFSFRYNIVDQRDPRDARHTARWQKITSKQATDLALSINNFVVGLATGPGVPQLNAWLAEANTSLAGKTDFNDIQGALVAELNRLGDVKLPPEQEAMVKQVGTDFDAFIEERNDILDEIANGWIATFDYNNTRPVGTPSLSNVRFLAEKGAYKGSIDFTGNASLTFYNSRPTGPKAQTLRDFRFAGQLDVPIGDITKTGKFLISLAARYERLLEDEKILGSTVVVPKGDIGMFQAKLTIPIRGTAFKIPLSFTYANRTELIKEKEVRGNFGLTFDLDSLFAKFNPFTKN